MQTAVRHAAVTVTPIQVGGGIGFDGNKLKYIAARRIGYIAGHPFGMSLRRKIDHEHITPLFRDLPHLFGTGDKPDGAENEHTYRQKRC